MLTPPPRGVVLLDVEDERDFGPILATRPVFEVRVGALNLRERLICAGLGEGLSARTRPVLGELCAALLPATEPSPEGEDREVLVVDGRLVAPVSELLAPFAALLPGASLRIGDRRVARRVRLGGASGALGPAGPEDLPAPPTWSLVTRPWQWLGENDRLLECDAADLARLGAPERRIFGVEFGADSPRGRWLAAAAWSGRLEPGAIQVGGHPLLLGEGARVRAGAVIDTERGPVVLSPGCVVHPLSVVVGPAFLGPGTQVNPGAKLREGTSVGAFCKVGGEIEESIVLDLSNKQHDGFLGHALVGAWVNLGADTNGSDLKNNYGPVRVDLGAGPVDSGESFVGPQLADHAKTGIDTMLTTGAVVGVAANVYGGGFAPRFVPSFAWGGADGLREYRLEEALSTARTVMARRQARWSTSIEKLLRSVFERSAGDRDRVGIARP